MWNKDECHVEWWSAVQGLTELEPVRPALKAMPECFKNIPRTRPQIEHIKGSSIKHCPGFVDLYKHSYVVPMWCDVTLEVIPGKGIKYTPSIDYFNASWHSPEQFSKHIPENAKDSNVLAVKLESPWRVRTSPGWGMLQLPMLYEFNPNFECLSGIIYTEKFHELNNQIMVKHTNKFLIERGTPIAMYIPIKLSSNKFTVEDETKDQKYAAQLSNLIINSKFGGAYKQFLNWWGNDKEY